MNRHPPTQRKEPFRHLADELDRSYGAPARAPLPLGNKSDPLDELVFILLTVMTQYGVERTYGDLRRRFPCWDDALRAPEKDLAEALRPIGLSTQRARRIRALLAEIERREGILSLDRLRTLDDLHTEIYLLSLPGVGKKVARCVMLYSLDRNVFPVDTHVLRVLKRLGVLPEAISLAAAQDAIQERIPELLRYTLHVNLVVHGRSVCRARRPDCGACVLAPSCPAREA